MRNTLCILGLALAALLPGTAKAQSTTNEYSIRLRWEQPPADVDLIRVYAGKITNQWTHIKQGGRTNEMTAILPSGGSWFFAITYQNTNKIESPYSDFVAYSFNMTGPPTPRSFAVVSGSVKQIITITNLTVLP